MSNTKSRVCSIDIFRLFCAVLVIAIHTNPFNDINPEFAYFVKQMVSTLAVPYFFAIAGFFYIQKLKRGETAFFSYIRRIIVIYFIWSLLYYVLDFVIYGYKIPVDYTIGFWLRFLYNGTYYHFWFFPALIFAVCLTTLFFKLRLEKILLPISVLLYILGCFAFSYHELGMKIPGMNRLLALQQIEVIREVLLMGFPFFVSGYLAYLIKEKMLSGFSKKQVFSMWIITAIFWLAEMFILRKLGWQLSFEVTVFLYPMLVFTILLLVKHPLPERKKAAGTCRAIANFSYYAHPFIIVCMQQISAARTGETLTFLLTVLVCLCLGAAAHKWNNKYMNILIS